MRNLLFVYDADGTVMAKLMDAGHKTFSPATVNCDLRKLTHGNLRMKPAWKKFVQSLNASVEFEHRDGFRRDNPSLDHVALPAVLIRKSPIDAWTPFVSSDEFRALPSLEQLQLLVETRLSH